MAVIKTRVDPSFLRKSSWVIFVCVKMFERDNNNCLEMDGFHTSVLQKVEHDKENFII